MEEAAEWLTTMQEAPLTDTQETAFKEWCAQSKQHEQAWLRAQNLMGMIDSVPKTFGRKIWGRERMDRRTAIKALASILILAPVGKLAWDEWPELTADYRTAIGDTQKINLPDGSLLYLNTATSVNINFSDKERLIELIEGEILVETAKTKATQKNQPFIIQSKSGRIHALGTRFTVRQLDQNEIQVAVYEHAVAITPKSSQTETRINQGHSTTFNPYQTLKKSSLKHREPSWVHGQIISNNMKLGELIAEISRYRIGILRCDPAVAHYPISGVFQLSQTDMALDVIASTLPVRISRISPYWISITGK